MEIPSLSHSQEQGCENVRARIPTTNGPGFFPVIHARFAIDDFYHRSACPVQAFEEGGGGWEEEQADSLRSRSHCLLPRHSRCKTPETSRLLDHGGYLSPPVECWKTAMSTEGAGKLAILVSAEGAMCGNLATERREVGAGSRSSRGMLATQGITSPLCCGQRN